MGTCTCDPADNGGGWIHRWWCGLPDDEIRRLEDEAELQRAMAEDGQHPQEEPA
jgi:hypothetical protein